MTPAELVHIAPYLVLSMLLPVLALLCGMRP